MSKGKLKNKVAIVLDRSGSMSGIRNETIAAFNAVVDTVRKQSDGQDTTVSLFTFANQVGTVFFNANPDTLKPLAYSDYHPDGLTAMFDGVGLAVKTLRTLKDNDETSYLVIVVTDGVENASNSYSKDDIVKLLRETQQTDRWSFVFQMPPGAGAAFVRTFGIPTDNIREWEATSRGMVETQVATVSGLGGYFQARKQGQTRTMKFFTTDLSKLDVKAVQAKLDDISAQFKTYEVGKHPDDKEWSVKDFVEHKTGKSYVLGSAYYQLMKTEKIQPQKAVLIMEKGKKVVWGGREGRQLIGLPDGDIAKVSPGNHSNYDIFVQSTSVNRKLPRGTRVLVDVQQRAGMTPTWDHTAGGTK